MKSVGITARVDQMLASGKTVTEHQINRFTPRKAASVISDVRAKYGHQIEYKQVVRNHQKVKAWRIVKATSAAKKLAEQYAMQGKSNPDLLLMQLFSCGTKKPTLRQRIANFFRFLG